MDLFVILSPREQGFSWNTPERNISGTKNESSIINALFPGGSITGAPKERAMEIIDLIENYNRKFYTGSFGYITSDNKIDMNIAIRSMTVLNNKGEYPVGGGIVWDSNPTQEWNEAQSKSIIIDKTIKKYTKKHVW